MEIDTIAEWDAICRICLQEGQLHSLFDYDDEKSELNIAEKIMLCSPIVVSAVTNEFTFDMFLIALPILILSILYPFEIRYQPMENCQNKFVRIVYSIWM